MFIILRIFISSIIIGASTWVIAQVPEPPNKAFDIQREQMKQMGLLKEKPKSKVETNAEIYLRARKNQIEGPQSFDLDDVAIFNLPLGYSFIATNDSRALMAMMNNFVSNDLLGIVVATNDKEMDWFAVVSYSPLGYIHDNGGENINAESLLNSIDTQIKLQNNTQTEGFKISEISWLQKPIYDDIKKHLSWILHTKISDIPDDDASGQGINIKQILLSREGFISINLATSLSEIEFAKSNAATIANNINFKANHLHSDFQEGADVLADITLLELISGVTKERMANPTGDEVLPTSSAKEKVMTNDDTVQKPISKKINELISIKSSAGGYRWIIWVLTFLLLLAVAGAVARKYLKNKASEVK